MKTAKESEKSKISLLSATMLSTTCMLGSGWLFNAQLAAKIAGNWSFLAWFLTALLVLSVGFCLSKVVSRYPVEGGMSRLSSLSHNSIFGTPFAFANWFGIIVVVSTEAQATTQYLSTMLGSFKMIEGGTLTYTGKFFALFVLSIYLIINYFGIKLLVRVNNAVTFLKIFAPIMSIIMIFSLSKFNNNFNITQGSDFDLKDGISAIIGAGLIYSFNGFQVSASFASEIKNPLKNIPLSILSSVILILILYTTIQYVFMSTIPHELLIEKGGWRGLNFSSPLLDLTILLNLNFIANLIIVDSIVSPSATGYTYLGTSSRMLQGMSIEKQIPSWIAKISPTSNLSKRFMLINWVIAAVILLNTKNWHGLMVFVTIYHIIGYMSAPISMGAIFPKTRLIGLIVFMILSGIMITIPIGNLLIVNFVITILLSIYTFIQRRIGIRKILAFNSPFIIYLWIIYLLHSYLFILVSIIFYLFITSKKYVKMCKIEKVSILIQK